MKSNCKVIQENIEYKNLNGIRRRYDIIEVDGIKITRGKEDKLFAEKYRPRKIFDLITTSSIRAFFEECIKKGSMPHTLLYSQKGGLGKTSSSQVMTHELDCEFMTLSANIERGIQAVKDKLIPFCSQKAMFGKNKMACIEEIGDATAQQIDSLKSVIDKYSGNMNIIITTNSLGNISQPLRTRFKIIDLNNFTDEETKDMTMQLFKRIKAILDIEEIEYSMEDIKYLYTKFKFSFREILMAIDGNVIDGKLNLQGINEDKTSLNDILEMINKKDYKGLASSSDSVNVIQFLEELNNEYLNILGDMSMIPNLIIIMNELQNSLLKNPAFPGLTFVKCCHDMIRENISFRV